MKNNLFDNYVKEQLGSYKPEVPAHIWENIAAKTGKRKPAGFWGSLHGTKRVAAVLFLLAATGSIVYFLSRNTVPANISSSLPKNNSKDQHTSSTHINPANSSSPAAPLIGNTDPIAADLKNNNTTALQHSPDKYPSSITAPARFVIAQQPGDIATNETQQAVQNNPTAFLSPADMNFNLLRSRGFNPRLMLPALPKNVNIPCPEKDAAGNKRYIEVYAGPDYAFRSFSDTANSAYMQQRKASTSLLFAYSAGIRYTKVFGSGMSVRTGINYTQVNEKFKVVKGQVTQNVYITNNNGDTIGTSTVTGTQYKESVNKFRSIDIPVTVGYELGNGKLHANVNAGAMINIHSKQTGFVIDDKGDAVDVSSAKTSPAYKYKTNAGISLTGGLSVYYKVSEKLHVLAEPYVRYSLSPVTKPDLTLKEKQYITGLRIGLRRDL